MRCSLDRLGYPYAHVPDSSFAIGLLPLSKYEFEEYLAAPSGPGDALYLEMLAVSPRLGRPALREASDPAGAFLAGVRPLEVAGFASWLDPRARIPTAREWQMAFHHLREVESGGISLPSRTAREAASIWNVTKVRRPRGSEAALMEGGLGEWVRCSSSSYGLLGRPEGTLWPTGHGDPLIPANDARNPHYGSRLVLDLTGFRSKS